MSYGRIREVEPQLEAEVSALLRQAEAVDRAEDAEYGRKRRGDEPSGELQRREERLARIQEVKARLEERARVRAEEEERAKGASEEEIEAARAAAAPEAREQSNFTDPDSRIMPTKDGWVQGYNAQVVVDAASGVIVAEEVGAQSTDVTRLIPLLAQAEANLTAVGVSDGEWTAQVFTADAGYCSEANLAELERQGIDAYIATGRERHHGGGVDQERIPRTPKRAAMRAKLQTPAGRAIYAQRKGITEPVHGMTKQARGFRQFLLRGLAKVAAEFTLISLTHNLLKLWRARPASATA